MGRLLIALSSYLGLLIVYIFVVSGTSWLERTEKNKKIEYLIIRVAKKKEMKDKAAHIIGKICRLQLQLKNNKRMDLREASDLDTLLREFGNQNAEWRNYSTHNLSEEILIEISKLKEANKEVKFYFSVLANMVVDSRSRHDMFGDDDHGGVKSAQEKENALISSILLAMQDSDGFRCLKENEILNDYVSR